MKTFQRFLRESYELLPGTLLMVIEGGGFNRRIQYGVTNGRVVFKIMNLNQHGHEFKGTTTHEVLDISGKQTEVLLSGMKIHGEPMQSHLQLDGLPSGAIIEPTAAGAEGQYKKVDGLKWTKVGSPTGTKYDSFHFDVSLKYKWVK